MLAVTIVTVHLKQFCSILTKQQPERDLIQYFSKAAQYNNISNNMHSVFEVYGRKHVLMVRFFLYHFFHQHLKTTKGKNNSSNTDSFQGTTAELTKIQDAKILGRNQIQSKKKKKKRLKIFHKCWVLYSTPIMPTLFEWISRLHNRVR